MAQDSWPSPAHNSRAVTDTEYEKIAARFSDDGVYGSPSDAAVVSAGTGLQVNIRADVYASLRGHAWTSGTSTVSLPVGANSSGQTRTDRVVLRLDRSTWTVRAVVKAGTPGGSAPALTQQTGDTGVYEIPLARVATASGASAVSVTREELYVGARVRTCTSTTRNPSPVRGEMCFETDTGRVLVWTGTAWKIVYEDSSAIIVDATVSGWSKTADSVIDYQAGTVHFRLGNYTRTGGTVASSTDTRLPVLIPAAYRHKTRTIRALAYITGAKIGSVTIYPANDTSRPGQVWLTSHPQIAAGDAVLPGQVSWVVS
ncbi:hypothetical protein [Streptomyces kebangsaanensis]|uniref:hypothetical protein n=1 Tax=Streptomyces kebangsaanensis TaxID=864058 RepID=UPI00093A7010|nr:hypothetical protein [Streptomyces kebangsaanensis]